MEALAYCILLGWLVTGAYTVLLSSARCFSAQAGMTSLEQSAASTVRQITAELSAGDAASVRIGSVPAGIVFASPVADDGRVHVSATGDLIWQKYVCYYLGASGSVVRKEMPIPSPLPTAPPPIPSRLDTAYFSTNGAPGHALGWYAHSLSFGTASGGSVTIALTVTQDGPGAPSTIQVETQARLRN